LLVSRRRPLCKQFRESATATNGVSTDAGVLTALRLGGSLAMTDQAAVRSRMQQSVNVGAELL
jgi:hypothetical protein